MVRTKERSPEKAGGGGSSPSLATNSLRLKGLRLIVDPSHLEPISQIDSLRCSQTAVQTKVKCWLSAAQKGGASTNLKANIEEFRKGLRIQMEKALYTDRTALSLKGRRLEYFTIAWNLLEGLVAVIAGALAGSISLVGFGVDSFIEVTSGTTLLWRMVADSNESTRERNEKISLRIVGTCFLALALYIGYESISDLVSRRAPEHSIPGIILACVSLLVMPVLSRAKKDVGKKLQSAAMTADAKQTDFCMYLSAILLMGLLLNAALGWWWADPVAALIMVPIIAKEGMEGIRGKACDECC